jgi:hypothetical protein
MVQIKHTVSLTLILICFSAAELKFKKVGDASYGGVNEISTKVKRIGNAGEPDNILCSSQKFVGIVDGESPIADGTSLTPVHLANLVATEAFKSKQDGLFEGSIKAQEDLAAIQKNFETSFKNGLNNGVAKYRQVLDRLADAHYYKLASKIPDWGKIFSSFDSTRKTEGDKLSAVFAKYSSLKAPVSPPPLPVGDSLLINRKAEVEKAVDDFVTNAIDSFGDRVTKEKEDYLKQIEVFRRKINSGVAVIAGRLVNSFTKGGMISSDSVKPVLTGFQYGRSFVAILRRHDFKSPNPQDKETKYYNYRLKHYKQHHTREINRVFPDLALQLKQSPKIEKVQSFTFDIQKGDIVLFTDATLVDNFSYTFIEFLINFGLFKLSKDANWDVEGDADLKALVASYARKMSNVNTIKHVFGQVTGNKAFANFKDELKGTGLEKCEVFHFFHSLGSAVTSLKKFFGATNCVRDAGRAKYFFTTKADAASLSDTTVADNFNAAKISKVLSVANKLVQGMFANGIGEAPATDFPAFLTYNKIIEWKVGLLLAKSQKAASAASLTVTQFDAMIDRKEIGPSEGDLTIFTNVLIEGAPENTPLSCTQLQGSIEKELQEDIDAFAAATSNSQKFEDLELEFSKLVGDIVDGGDLSLNLSLSELNEDVKEERRRLVL